MAALQEPALSVVSAIAAALADPNSIVGPVAEVDIVALVAECGIVALAAEVGIVALVAEVGIVALGAECGIVARFVDPPAALDAES